jgi:hypothetical protein
MLCLPLCTNISWFIQEFSIFRFIRWLLHPAQLKSHCFQIIIRLHNSLLSDDVLKFFLFIWKLTKLTSFVVDLVNIVICIWFSSSWLIEWTHLSFVLLPINLSEIVKSWIKHLGRIKLISLYSYEPIFIILIFYEVADHLSEM